LINIAFWGAVLTWWDWKCTLDNGDHGFEFYAKIKNLRYVYG